MPNGLHQQPDVRVHGRPLGQIVPALVLLERLASTSSSRPSSSAASSSPIGRRQTESSSLCCRQFIKMPRCSRGPALVFSDRHWSASRNRTSSWLSRGIQQPHRASADCSALCCRQCSSGHAVRDASVSPGEEFVISPVYWLGGVCAGGSAAICFLWGGCVCVWGFVFLCDLCG